MQEWLKTFIKYLLWGMTPALPIISSAIGQQCIVLAVVWFLPVPVFAQNFLATVFFSVVYHLPNWRLVGISYMFGAVLYPIVFEFGLEWIALIAVLHAAGGTSLHRAGFDLRAWKF